MARLSVAIILLLIIASLNVSDASTVSTGLKCGKSDPRQTYPHCMLDRRAKTLWCDQSKYQKLPGVDEINSHLYGGDCKAAKALYVNDSCLQGIDHDDLRPYKEIRRFIAGQNYISSVKRSTFQENRKLEEIDLCQNNIAALEEGSFTGPYRLKRLFLNWNRISHIDHYVLSDQRQLEELFMDDNTLTAIKRQTFHRHRSLTILSLRGNSIAFIDDLAFKNNRHLRRLHLDGNKIDNLTTWTFQGLGKLEILTISHNRITVWPAEYGALFTNVHTLLLGSNQLEEFTSSHLAKMSSLQTLSLDNNSISEIPEDLFLFTPRLVYLNLSKNNLEDIPENSFKSLCHLESLILTKNKLHTPRVGWFHHVVKKYRKSHTAISGNLWRCDCSALQYQAFYGVVKRHGSVASAIFSNELEVTCDAPEFAQGRGLDKELVKEIQSQHNCTSELADLPDVVVSPASPKACDPDKSFHRENFDVTSQYVPMELWKVKQAESTLLESRASEPTQRSSRKRLSATVAVISILAMLIILTGATLLVCRMQRKKHFNDVYTDTYRQSPARGFKQNRVCTSKGEGRTFVGSQGSWYEGKDVSSELSLNLKLLER